MLLVYTGLIPVTFTDVRVGEVFPGDEFNLPDEDVAPFLVRADVRVVNPVPVPPVPDGPVAPLPVPTELLSLTAAVSEPDAEPEPEPPAADEAADEPVADEATTDHTGPEEVS